jgi:hypothetical protein
VTPCILVLGTHVSEENSASAIRIEHGDSTLLRIPTYHSTQRQITDSGLRKYKQNYVTYMLQVVSRVTTATCETLCAAKCHRPPPPPPFLPKLPLLLLTTTTTTATLLLLQNKPKCAQGLHAALFYEVLIEDSNFSSDEGQSRAI